MRCRCFIMRKVAMAVLWHSRSKSRAHIMGQVPKHDAGAGASPPGGDQAVVVGQLVLGVSDVQLGPKLLQHHWHLQVLLCCLLPGVNPGPACQRSSQGLVLVSTGSGTLVILLQSGHEIANGQARQVLHLESDNARTSKPVIILTVVKPGCTPQKIDMRRTS